MKGIFFASILSTLLLMIAAAPATAQQPAKIPRIAVLIGSSLAANAVRIDAFRHSLRDLGYVKGKNIGIEFRSAEGKFDRLPELAAEIVRLNVDVIVTTGPTATRQGTDFDIPIVMAQDIGPVGSR